MVKQKDLVKCQVTRKMRLTGCDPLKSSDPRQSVRQSRRQGV